MPKIYPGIKRKSNHYNNQVRNQKNCYTLLHPLTCKKKKKISFSHTPFAKQLRCRRFECLESNNKAQSYCPNKQNVLTKQQIMNNSVEKPTDRVSEQVVHKRNNSQQTLRNAKCGFKFLKHNAVFSLSSCPRLRLITPSADKEKATGP